MPSVLVVESQSSIKTVVRYQLENEGFEGFFADDLEHAWQLLVSERPDAAVVDVNGGGDGWGLVRRMRSDGRFESLPIVVLAGRLESEVVEQAKRLACDYLSKPFAASVLLGKLDSLITAQDGGRAEAETTASSQPGTPEQLRVEMVSAVVIVLLDHYRIEGSVHLPPELPRFSDAWESIMRDPRLFIPITDARVFPGDVEDEVGAPSFLEVRKSDIRAVFPRSALNGGRNASEEASE